MIYEGNCRLGDLFTSRREKGRPGLPTLSVTLNDGLVNREDMERKQDTSLAPEEHLLVKPGDIAYNMMRMWQGAFGLADGEGLVSPAYVVLKGNGSIDPQYASYLFKTARMKYLFWAYSYGLTDDRLRLYFPDFGKIPAIIPTKATQGRIAKVLATWDAAISVSEKLRDANDTWRRSIVNSLLLGTSKLAKHRSKRTEVRLGKVADVLVSSVDKKHDTDEPSISLCNYTHVYYNRYLTKSVSYDTGTASTSEIERFQLKKWDVVITKDSEEANDIGVAACVSEHIENLVCGYHLAIIRPKEGLVDSVYLSSLFSLHEIRKHFAIQSNGVTRFGLPVKSIESLSLKLPSIQEQREVATLIHQLDQEQLLNTHRLELLKREKAALVQQILTGKPCVIDSALAKGGAL